MHSNWKIWDFLKSRPKVIETNGPKLIALQSFDPYAFKIIKEKIPYEIFENNQLITLMGKDITAGWIEDNLMSLGLFGNSDSYLILKANELKKECKELLLKVDELILSESFLILDYSEEDDLLEKLKKSDLVEVIKIQAPAFWENDKLLDFLCGHKKVYLDLGAKDLILEKVVPEMSVFFNVLEQASINFPGKANISAGEIEAFIGSAKIDQFEFASLFGRKKVREFYQKLSEIEDENDLRQIFSFMQSHLLKVYDPEYLNKKSRQTGYDKQVLSQSRIWDKAALKRAMAYFSEMEIMAKSKKPLIFARIKKDHLRMMF
jgi:hypothetical protein